MSTARMSSTMGVPPARTASPSPSRVSVVIPVFDRPEDVRRAVRSACRQSCPVFEIIVVDDASPLPVTRAGLGTRDDRVRIVRLEQNVGPAAARMAGVEAAEGDLVAFLDSDDVWHPRKIAEQMRIFAEESREPGLVAVVCGWRYGSHDDARIEYRMPLEAREVSDFASGCWFSPGSTLLIAREAFQIVGPFDPGLRRLEDLEWFLRFALHGGRLVTAPTVGVSIRRGRNARATPVGRAAEIILERFRRSRDPQITGLVRRRLKAWLHVERAAAARNGRLPLRMAYHLTLSLLLVPRARVELRRWWTRPAAPIPADSEFV